MNCDFCDEDINHLALAHIHVRIHTNNFCSDVCAEMWLDKMEGQEGKKVTICIDQNEDVDV